VRISARGSEIRLDSRSARIAEIRIARIAVRKMRPRTRAIVAETPASRERRYSVPRDSPEEARTSAALTSISSPHGIASPFSMRGPSLRTRSASGPTWRLAFSTPGGTPDRDTTSSLGPSRQISAWAAVFASSS